MTIQLQQVRARIEGAAKNSGRDPGSIRLIAVSKGQEIGKIVEACQTGQKDFGENYAQELLEKIPQLSGQKIDWHFVGHLQRNKAAKILPHITWLHSLDSLALAETIQQKAKQPLRCLIEVNLLNEPKKSGLSPEAVLDFISKLKEFDKIDLRGLMTMAPAPHFKKLFELLKTINTRYLYPRTLTELSMGMSGDFEMAIQEGATMVRVGEEIFGKRI